MPDLPGRHRTPYGIGPADIADTARLGRWAREQELLEQQTRDRRAMLRGRIIWTVVLLVIALDVAVALAVIFVFTA